MTDLITLLTAQLITDEGEKLKPYRDTVGKLTIGIGRNLDNVGISDDEARYLLKNDIMRILPKAAALPYWSDLTDNRRLVLLNMGFNMGWPTLMTFTKTLKAVADKRYTEAADMMLQSLWAKQVGARALRLSNLMRSG